MDKSQTPPGRDTYLPGPDKVATPITEKQMLEHALAALTKGFEGLYGQNPVPFVPSKHGSAEMSSLIVAKAIAKREAQE